MYSSRFEPVKTLDMSTLCFIVLTYNVFKLLLIFCCKCSHSLVLFCLVNNQVNNIQVWWYGPQYISGGTISRTFHHHQGKVYERKSYLWIRESSKSSTLENNQIQIICINGFRGFFLTELHSRLKTDQINYSYHALIHFYSCAIFFFIFWFVFYIFWNLNICFLCILTPVSFVQSVKLCFFCSAFQYQRIIWWKLTLRWQQTILMPLEHVC